jgi:mRNA interferase HicA
MLLMKLHQFIKYIEDNKSTFYREGKKHTIYFNSINKQVSSIPGHMEINIFFSKKICNDLGIPLIP